MKSNPFFWLFIPVAIGGCCYGMFKASSQRKPPIAWHKTDGKYVCPKCGSTDTKIDFHAADQVCGCLGRPNDMDHMEVDCKTCRYGSFDALKEADNQQKN